ncbi:MAG: 2-C-methyl-D-erythritol 2,4-cyclodiphosphate synthase [Phycisphaerae bacterium]|nr:2-C-methyl-D-erythritol 2,4-cyclodiphosphate synthase [Phycisphaerae bacterium]MDW8261863.1 2-C-methyl-D-erythritol 2,4-cyclodiphosphate synthase [Phycisphaerales bacterium]
MTDFRIGHGYDIHRIRPGSGLVLAGVVVSRELAAVAHSDGDVAIHAAVDAILGAMAAGDIGQHFPDSDPRWSGADSTIFLRRALELAKEAGYRPVNLDLTILAERPRLGACRSEMAARLESILGCPVNVKAGTHEGCGAIGRGEAVAAHAVVLLVKA